MPTRCSNGGSGRSSRGAATASAAASAARAVGRRHRSSNVGWAKTRAGGARTSTGVYALIYFLILHVFLINNILLLLFLMR